MTQKDCLGHVNSLFKQYDLKGWTFKFNTNKFRLGVCYGNKRVIALSMHHVNNNSDESIIDTLKHEIAHALVGVREGHNATWKAKCIEIGCSPERCGKVSTGAPLKYSAVCSKCNKLYGFHKMNRKRSNNKFYCSSCGPSYSLVFRDNARDNMAANDSLSLENIDKIKLKGGIGALSRKSQQLTYRCPRCFEKVEILSVTPFGKSEIKKLSCGHSITSEKLVVEKSGVDYTLLEDGRRLFDFQKVTVENMIKANGRCLLALDMGLGKTICTTAFTRQFYEESQPILVVTKSGLILQWFEEYVKTCGVKFAPIIIENAKQSPIPGYPIHLVSYTLLTRLDVKDWNFKTIILDECQHIKNPETKATNKVRELASKAHFVIATSGTPFKNNITEYFTILNILRPDKHGSFKDFKYRWVKYDINGKSCGLNDPERFLEYNSDFVFRFEREQVLPDLPSIFRQFRYVQLTQDLTQAYENVTDEFNAFYAKMQGSPSLTDYNNILGFFARMRQIAGLAKVEGCCEFVEDFSINTSRKLTIFVHHKDVHSFVEGKLNKLGISNISLRAELNGDQRHEVIRKFRETDVRVMIASTLASGEGLNLQFCSDCIMLERQWNPANEEQAEARFPRPGSIADKINATYFVALNTIDEFLHLLVEKKRQMVREGMLGSINELTQQNVIMELAEQISKTGKKKWSFK